MSVKYKVILQAIVLVLSVGLFFDFFSFYAYGTETEVEESISPESAQEDSDEQEPTETEDLQEPVTPTQPDIIEEPDTVKITEIDLGDYLKEMTVGERQLLLVTLIPTDVEETTITYASSNTKVATINGLGRIEALRVGNTTITVSAGDIRQSFVLEVKEKEDNNIPVTDIEIGNHESVLEVGKTLNITGTVLPTDATESKITFTSSDPSVATVNSSGEVKGIGKGQVIITLSAGGVSKDVSLTVKVPTTEIKLSSTYIVLKKGQQYLLTATVIPEEAGQKITYKSENSTVAEVSEDGVITAKENGNTTILITNGDSIAASTVIVNESVSKGRQEDGQSETTEDIIVYDTIVYASEQNIINIDMLTYLYKEKKTLKLIGDGYSVEIRGKDIVNYNNEFYTDIFLENKGEETSFKINNGQALCGPIYLSLDGINGKYLYLYNSSKDKYELIDMDNTEYLKLTTAGKYRLSNERTRGGREVIQYLAFGIALASLTSSIIYIVNKKKYWFW